MLRILKYLGYHEAAQSPKTEVLAGGTTFLAMVYIVVVTRLFCLMQGWILGPFLSRRVWLLRSAV